MTPVEPVNASDPGADATAPPEDAIVDDATVIAVRRRASAEPPDDATVVSKRRRGAPDPVEDDTAVSARRRSEPEHADDETVVSVRRRPAPDPVDDHTVVSVRRRAGSEPVDTPGDEIPVDDTPGDDTVPSRRSRGATVVRPAPDDDTMLSRRAPVPAGTARELEDTLLRPLATPRDDPDRGRAPATRAEGGRDARIPDAEALRTPVPPRPLPPASAVRAPAPARPPSPERPAPAGDHESLERAARTRDRRRTLIVVLAAAAVALGSAGALVFLLT